MQEQYGEKKGDEVFYASEHSGRIKGVKEEHYADGGKVAKKEPKKGRGRTTQMESRSARDAVSGSHRRRQMKELGLKDGGEVKRKLSPRPPMPPPERGEKPKRITTPGPPGGRRPKAKGRDERLSPRGYRDGGKVVKSVTNC